MGHLAGPYTTPPWMGCPPSQGYPRPPPKISLGFPENLPVLIYTPGWREYSVLPRNTTL